MKGNIHIGTSGWSYKHWRGLYYPEKLPSAKWLEFYAETYDTTELNASFYRLPSPKTPINWKKRVSPDFRFCVKMSRYLTHMKKLIEPEETLERFFDIFSPMKKIMGPVLIQLPPMLKFNYERARHLYALLRRKYKAYDFVMEVRHNTWLAKESLELMSSHNIGLVISQSGVDFPFSEYITGKNIYVRFHGPKELYASSYPDEMLKTFAGKFRIWAKKGHEVWAFFNNDIHGHAVYDSRRLIEMVKKKKEQ